MLTRMLQRRGTEQEWYDVRNTAILQPGEIGLETNTGRFKIGNGVNVWIDLPYYLPDNNPTNNGIRANKNNADIYSKLIANQTFIGTQTLTSGNATQIPLLVAGKESQSASLQRWANSTDQTLASMSSTGKLTATGAQFDADVDLNGNAIINVKDIDSNSTDSYAVNKKYVDEAIAGLLWKDPVNLVSVATGTDLFDWVDVPTSGLTGTVELDGHGPLTSTHGNGYRLLLVNQTTTENNGIWVYTDNGTSYELSRPTDADTFEELKGASVFVQEGTLYGTSSFVQTEHYLASFAGQQWVQFNGASQITAGAGLEKSGNVLFTNAGAGIQINENSIQVAESGIVSSMIANDTIVDADINTNADIAPTKILGDAVTKADTGTVTSLMILNNTIVNADINEDADIEPSKILGDAVTKTDVGTVTSTMIQNLTIVEGDIADSAITSSKIANGTIVDADISTTADINTAKLKDFKLDKLTDVTITEPVENKQILRYNGLQWINETPSGGISISPTPPDSAVGGDAWFDSTDGSLYVYYDDGDANILPVSSLSNVTVYSSLVTGFRTRLDYSASYNSGTNSHLISYTYSIITGPGSYITNLPIYAYLSIDGTQVWVSSGNYTFPTNSTTTLTTGSYSRPFTANSVNNVQLITSLVGASALPPQLDSSSISVLATGVPSDSAQWVQVKANSALEASILTRMSASESRLTTLEQVPPGTSSVYVTAPLTNSGTPTAAQLAVSVGTTSGTVAAGDHTHTTYVEKVNGTVTTASTSSNVVRNITLSTSAPTGGNDGDVWLVYA